MLLLDRPAFPFDDPEGQELLDTLLKIYYLEQPVRAFVLRAGIHPADIGWGRSMADVWPQVLEKAARARLLRPLVQSIAEAPESAAYPIFKTLLTQTLPTGGTDPCAAHLIGRDQPRAFIDRHQLRYFLRNMLEDGGNRVLIVTGDRSTGKSWTWFLLRHVLGTRRTTPYLIDLATYTAPARVTDLAEELIDQLGWEPGPSDHFASEDAQARRLVNSIKRRMRATDEECWLVFDGLEATALTEPALRMIESLAVAVAKGETADRLRMVLISYDGQLPPSIDPYVWRERLTPIGVEDLRDFFGAVARSAGVRIDRDAADVLVSSVLREAMGEHAAPPATIPLNSVSALAAKRARQLYVASGGTGE